MSTRASATKNGSSKVPSALLRIEGGAIGLASPVFSSRSNPVARRRFGRFLVVFLALLCGRARDFVDALALTLAEDEDDDAYLQACDEVLSTSWLFSCADKEIWPPKARDWIKVSPSVATLYDKTIDAFGDAHASENLNDEDLRAMMHQVRSRKRRGTEFKLLKHIDDEDRQKLRKILRLSSDDDVAKNPDATDENVEVKEARERHHFASARALELIERRKHAAAEMLRMY